MFCTQELNAVRGSHTEQRSEVNPVISKFYFARKSFVRKRVF